MSWKASVLAVALAAAMVPSFSHAQNNDGGNGGQAGGQRQRGQGGPGGGGPGGGGGGNRWDPARMTEFMKEQLKAQDDEWRVIEPKLTKVVEAQRNARSGMGMGGMGGGRRGQGGGGGGGPGGGNQPSTPLTQAQNDLRTAVESDASSPEDIDKKLQAVRAARADAQTKLEAARKDLKEVLTPKQEAQLVLLGVLE